MAREIARLTGARVIDNHYVNNPIFALVAQNGIDPLPDAVWDRVAEVRSAVHETIATLSPPSWSFVFTHVAFGQDPVDLAIYERIRETAERRRARFQPVRLICDVEELVRRIASPERKERLKDISPDNARAAFKEPLMSIDHPAAIDLDITHLPPKEAARIIVAAAEEA